MPTARRDFLRQTAAEAMQWRAFGSRLFERKPAFMSLSAA